MNEFKHLALILPSSNLDEVASEEARRLLEAAPEGAQFTRLPIPTDVDNAGYLHQHVRFVSAWDFLHGKVVTRLDIAWELAK